MSSFKRFFSFGCSFTRYWWETWADIIAFDLEIPYYNFGYPGIGNTAITSYINYADSKYKFTKDDLIIVQWTSPFRHDFLDKNKLFDTLGSVELNDWYYNEDYREKYFNHDDCMVKTLSNIICVNNAYKVNYNMSMSSIEIANHRNELTEVLFNKLPDIKYFFDGESSEPECWNGMASPDDKHPDIKQHLDMVIKNVYPSLNIGIKPTTIDYFENLQENFITKLGDGFMNEDWATWKMFLKKNLGEAKWLNGFPLLEN